MFNRADKVIAKMKKKREEKEQRDKSDGEDIRNVEIEGLGTEGREAEAGSESDDDD